MGSTAHVGVDTLDVDDPDGSCEVIRQSPAPDLVNAHNSFQITFQTMFFFFMDTFKNLAHSGWLSPNCLPQL